MLIPDYRDLLNRALAQPALADDPEDDEVLFMTATGRGETSWDRSQVRQMLKELREIWGAGTQRDQEQFAAYVANITSGRLAGQ